MQKTFGITAAAVGAMAFMALAPNALANTETEGPFSYGPHLTDFGGTNGSPTPLFFSVPQFNPTLGTLTNINVELDTSFTTSIIITNSSGAASNGSADTQVTEGITNGTITNAAFPMTFTGSTVGKMRNVPSNGVSYVLSAGGTTTEADSGSDSSTSNFNSGPALTLFTGLGNVTMNIGTFTETQLSNTGGVTSAAQVTQDTLGATFIYTYTPAGPGGTPEPGAWGLLCAGSTGGLVFLRRRRARK
jgi:hypothetical protein